MAEEQAVEEEEQEAAGDKVYVLLAQTDGLGLGAWTKPGRGDIPYTWEVTLVDYELQPSLLQMFYQQSTPNDYFVGGLSGPGYIYPNAMPPASLRSQLNLAKSHMENLDIDQMTIFDASQTVGEDTCAGDTNLHQTVVEAYFEVLGPRTNGLLNGYAPAFTFANTSSNTTSYPSSSLPTINKKAETTASLFSFNYYLDPGKSVAGPPCPFFLVVSQPSQPFPSFRRSAGLARPRRAEPPPPLFLVSAREGIRDHRDRQADSCLVAC